MIPLLKRNNMVKKPLNSAFYTGTVFHKRLTPKEHQFQYPLYMSYIDLDEINHLNQQYWWFSSRKLSPLQLKIDDYFREKPNCINIKENDQGEYLKQTAIAIAATLGAKIGSINRVCMLAQLRCLGIYFSPVNFFFLYENNEAKYLLAEVSNTPWNKKHCYLIDLSSQKPCKKTFHVSPFMNLDMDYHWQIKPPVENTSIRIENWKNKQLFIALFTAKRRDIRTSTLRYVFFRWPIVTLFILAKIYWQALKLYLKGIKYVPYQHSPIDEKNS